MKSFINFTIWCIIMEAVLCYEARKCSSPDDCAPNECCVIGMERYSEPRCVQLGEPGDHCLLDNEPEDKDLYYPNGVVQVHSVYRLFCPCSESLTCSRGQCTKQ